MIYLVSKFHCTLVSSKNIDIIPNVKYQINSDIQPCLVVGYDNEIPFIFELNSRDNANISRFKVDKDTLIILNAKKYLTPYIDRIQFGKKEYIITLTHELKISCDGKVLLNSEVNDIEYSHYETVGEYLIIYFKGKRKYVAVIKDKELVFSNYYDEINIDGEDRFFMCRLYDSLNHGRVYSITQSKFESYLIYLDNDELNLKEELATIIFLDCIICGNLKYANMLLHESIRQDDASKISQFFPEFDTFYTLEKDKIVLIKKDTLVGICKFELNHGKITNIIVQ